MANAMAPGHILLFYILGISVPLTLFTAWRLWQSFSQDLRCRTATFVRGWLVYHPVIHRPRGSTDFTYFHLLVLIIYTTANALTVLLDTRGTLDVAQRSAKLSLVNLALLYLGGRTGYITDRLLRLPLESYVCAHRWMGRVCIILASVHVALQLQAKRGLRPLQTALLVIAATLFALALLPLRRRFYNFFRVTHAGLAIAMLVLLWLHVGVARQLSTICLIVASSLWLCQSICRAHNIIWQNRGIASRTRADLVHESTGEGRSRVSRLEIWPKRPWTVRPGQYVYVTIPQPGSLGLSRLQSNPFHIAWTEEMKGEADGRAESITLYIEAKNGFSRELASLLKGNLNLLIEGPFGDMPHLDNYDKVMLVASDMGFAPLLYMAKVLLDGHAKCTARVRRLTICWFLDETHDQSWALKHLQSLLKKQDNTSKIMTVELYSKASPQPYRKPIDENYPRLLMGHPGPFNMKSVIEREFELEGGNMLLAACGSPQLESSAQVAIRGCKYRVDFKNMSFQPDAPRRSVTGDYR